MRMSVNLSERQVRKNRTRHERQKSWRLLPRFALRECLSLRGSSVEDNVLNVSISPIAIAVVDISPSCFQTE